MIFVLRRSRQDRSALVAVLAPVAALALGLVVAGVGPGRELVLLSLLVIGVGVVGWIASRGPVFCFSALACVAAAGGTTLTIAAGAFDFAVTDVLFVVGVVLTLTTPPRAARTRSGSVALKWWGVFLAAVALSLAWHGLVGDTDLFGSAISWLRLVQTATLMWLVSRVIGSADDARRLVLGVSVGSLIAVGIAAVQFLGSPGAGRYGGLAGVATLGLTSSSLVIIGFTWRPSSPPTRAFLVCAGLLGLLFSRSITSIFALVVVLGVSAVITGVRRSSVTAGVRFIVAAGAVLVAAFAVPILRPGSMPWQQGFDDSSTQARSVYVTAAWETFLRQPAFGVGWHQQDLSDSLGATLKNRLRARFPNASPQFIDDIGRTSPHNAVLQVAAEAGLPSLLTLAGAGAATMLALRRRAWEPLARDDASVLSTLRRLAAMVAVWFLGTPVFGGQPETILLGVVLGAAFAAWSTSRNPAAVRGAT